MPHIHAECQDDRVVMDLEGNVLEGSLPKAKLNLLVAWIQIHKEDLEANWRLLSAGDGFFRIDLLRLTFSSLSEHGLFRQIYADTASNTLQIRQYSLRHFPCLDKNLHEINSAGL